MNKSKLPDLRSIPLENIDLGDRLRDVSDDEVAKLCLSIQEQGLQNPIVVRPFREVNPKDTTKWLKGEREGFVLVSGGHRFKAAEVLQWSEIPTIVIDPASPLEARLLEIDENLYRHELNALDRATFLAERKEIYEEIYPETKHGAQGGVGGKKNEKTTVGFSLDAAEKTGLSNTTIKRAISIHNGLAPEVRSRIKGTWLAMKQGELLLLAGCDHKQQSKIVDLLFREKDPAKSVCKAKRHLAGHVDAPSDPDKKIRRRLFLDWDNAPTNIRMEFLKMLEEQGFLSNNQINRDAA